MPNTPTNSGRHTLTATDHPYLTGAWTPVFDECDADDLEVIGEIPADLDGIYFRNTENPVHEAIGLYHPFDGDGMIHAMAFRDGRARYCNRFVRTRAFMAEQEAGQALWAGIAEDPRRSLRPGWGAHGSVKDASSTDVVIHAGKVLSTFYQCGEGYRLDPHTLETLGTEAWTPLDGISAHPKVDETTGELLFFNYSTHAPYMHYGVVGADNRLKHYVPIPLPGPRLPHDMAFTRHYSGTTLNPLLWLRSALPDRLRSARSRRVHALANDPPASPDGCSFRDSAKILGGPLQHPRGPASVLGPGALEEGRPRQPLRSAVADPLRHPAPLRRQ